MLHFPPNNVLTIYNWVCDFEELKRFGENNYPLWINDKRGNQSKTKTSMVHNTKIVLYLWKEKVHLITT
jgi:hypothetical protein